jgi:plasmid maintenance system antidote protein VapI
MTQHIMLRWMEVHHKTVDDLAEAAGCTPSHIRNLLAGRKEASLSLAKRLSDISGGIVPMDAFLRSEATP